MSHYKSNLRDIEFNLFELFNVQDYLGTGIYEEMDVVGHVRRVGGYFLKQLEGYGLLTAEISYYMPDHPSLLQLFVLQQYDVAPRFPMLHEFLDHWRREIEATLHSIRIAHNHLIGPAEWRAVDGIISIH